jgi:hypothetical protein
VREGLYSHRLQARKPRIPGQKVPFPDSFFRPENGHFPENSWHKTPFYGSIGRLFKTNKNNPNFYEKPNNP